MYIGVIIIFLQLSAGECKGRIPKQYATTTAPGCII